MDLFKKRKENPRAEAPVAAPQAPAVLPPAPEPAAPPLPDSAQLAEARVKAQEHIRLIEEKIAAERAAWEQRLREKNEQKISLKSKLEMIVRRGAQERAQKEAELALLKQQQEADMAEMERTLEEEIRHWAEKVSLKDKEVENVRHDAMIAETGKTVENEQKLQALQRDVEQARQNVKKFERQLQEEQAGWMGRIKAKDDEIVQLMTQLSLRETQIGEDELKAAAARREREESWQAQTRALEEELARQQEEWEQRYAAKEAERIALKNALEERLAAAGQESEQKNNEITRAVARIEERAGVIEAAISREREKWQDVLKGRDEELNKLRVALMLSESQDKAEREKRSAALREAETAAARRVKDIAGRIEEEKARWVKNIAGIDEEINVIRIQTELKLKELHDAFERRKVEAGDEKVRLAAQLIDLNTRFAREKAALAAALEEKAGQIGAFQNECQAKQQALAREEQQAIAALKARKDALEMELNDLEQTIVQEKSRWAGLIRHKETELESARKEAEARQNALRGELEILEGELRAGIEPLARQLEAQEEHLLALRKRTEDELAKKDGDHMLLREQFSAREEQYIRRIKALTEKYHAEEIKIAGEAETLAARIRETQEAGRVKIEELAAAQKNLAHNIAELADKKNADKESLTIAYQSRKEELQAAIAQREAECAAQQREWETALAAKGMEVSEYEASVRRETEQYQHQLAAKEKELADLTAAGEQEAESLKEKLAKTRADYAARAAAEQERGKQQEAALKEAEAQVQKECAELAAGLRQAIAPLEEQLHALEERLVSQTEEAQAALAAQDQRAREMEAWRLAEEQKFRDEAARAEQRLAAEKTEAHRILTHLAEDAALAEAAFQKQLADNAVVIAGREALYAQRAAAQAQESAALRSAADEERAKATDDIARLSADIQRQEQEYPQAMAVRVKEIEALEKQISERAAFYAGQQEQAEQNFEKFQRRSQQRIAQATAELAAAKAGWQQDAAAAQARLQAALDEYTAKEGALQEELARMTRQYTEEKKGHEKQKLILEESLQDLQKRAREDLEQKEKAIILLQGELAEKERVWEATWRSKEEEFAAERHLFNKQVAALETSLKQEEDLAHKRLLEKENEITFYKNQYTAKIQALTAEINDKRQAWIEANGSLSNQVKVLEHNFEQAKATNSEMRAAREKELSALKSNIEFWEIKSAAEEEKRLAAWAQEKASLEGQIAGLRRQMDANEQAFSQKFDGKAAELIALQSEQRALEDAATRELKSDEETYHRQQAALAAHVASLEQKIRDGNAAAERECAALDQATEKLKLERTFKDTVRQAEGNKRARKWEKLQYTMRMQLKGLQETLEDEERQWDGRISAKDEEIKTLSVRLTTRRERRDAEVKRRREEAERIIGRLTGELQVLEAAYVKTVPEKEKEAAEKKKLLQALQNDVRARETAWQREVAENDAAAAAAYKEMSAHLAAAEKEVKKERARLKELLALREEQIKGLTLQMMNTEALLMKEKEYTAALIEALQKKATEFHAGLRQMRRESPSEAQESTVAMFEKAVGLYNAGRHTDALAALNALIAGHPSFAGAYQYGALCLYQLNEKAAAKKMAERALELDPRNNELRQWIGSLNS